MPSHISLGMCGQVAYKTWHVPCVQAQCLSVLRLYFSCTERIIEIKVINPCICNLYVFILLYDVPRSLEVPSNLCIEEIIRSVFPHFARQFL